jgi:hypothetical protein
MRSFERQQMWHVFVSYASNDRGAAEALADDLCAFSGARGAVWCQNVELATQGGLEQWIQFSRLEQAAAIFVPVLSREALETPALLDLLSTAHYYWLDRLLDGIIAVLAAPCELPKTLESVPCVPLSPQVDRDEALDDLVTELKRQALGEHKDELMRGRVATKLFGTHQALSTREDKPATQPLKAKPMEAAFSAQPGGAYLQPWADVTPSASAFLSSLIERIVGELERTCLVANRSDEQSMRSSAIGVR